MTVTEVVEMDLLRREISEEDFFLSFFFHIRIYFSQAQVLGQMQKSGLAFYFTIKSLNVQDAVFPESFSVKRHIQANFYHT